MADIDRCVINNNFSARDGGGLYECDGMITNSTIGYNFGDWGGGLYGCDGLLRNCLIVDNASEFGGGLWWCQADITNCTIADNESINYAGGLSYCNGQIINSIIWQNSAPQMQYSSEPTYSCIENYIGSGTGNINTAPCFADVNNGDYHLKSEKGRWSPFTVSWLADDVTSLCIDAGHPASDWRPELWPRYLACPLPLCRGAQPLYC